MPEIRDTGRVLKKSFSDTNLHSNFRSAEAIRQNDLAMRRLISKPQETSSNPTEQPPHRASQNNDVGSNLRRSYSNDDLRKEQLRPDTNIQWLESKFKFDSRQIGDFRDLNHDFKIVQKVIKDLTDTPQQALEPFVNAFNDYRQAFTNYYRQAHDNTYQELDARHQLSDVHQKVWNTRIESGEALSQAKKWHDYQLKLDQWLTTESKQIQENFQRLQDGIASYSYFTDIQKQELKAVVDQYQKALNDHHQAVNNYYQVCRDKPYNPRKGLVARYQVLASHEEIQKVNDQGQEALRKAIHENDSNNLIRRAYTYTGAYLAYVANSIEDAGHNAIAITNAFSEFAANVAHDIGNAIDADVTIDADDLLPFD